MRVATFFTFFFIAFISAKANGIVSPKKALIIAIGDYSGSKWGNISSANDIPYIKSGLKKAGFPDNSILVVADKKATKSNILRLLDSLIRTAKKGDIIYIHYSGHAVKSDIGTGAKTNTYLIPYTTSDCYTPTLANDCWKEYISSEAIIERLNKLRIAAGNTGQVVFTSDASHLGPASVEDDIANSNIQKTRGGFFEDFNKLSSTVGSQSAPFIFMSGCLDKQENFEVRDSTGNGVGAFSYAFGRAFLRLKEVSEVSYMELFRLIKEEVAKKVPRQLPAIAGDFNEKVFFHQALVIDLPEPPIAAKTNLPSNCYIVSIGVNDYKMSRRFIQSNNSVTDATKMTGFIEEQFLKIKSDTSRIISYLLLDNKATKKDIYRALNNVINQSKPEDYFIFNFCGFSFSYLDSNNKTEIYFAPYDVADIADSVAMKKQAISLGNFKDLFELIPANNQLIITEAGSAENFQQLFVKKLFETAPALHLLTKRNRIIIVPNGFGLDEFSCDGKKIESGPINYAITNLPKRLNIFSVFNDKKEAEKIEYAIKLAEVKCLSWQGKPYTRIFFEKQFMDELQYYMPDAMSSTRSSIMGKNERTTIRRSIRQKHALIIGTNTYSGKPTWSDLSNPVLDAKEIAFELETNFGYNTKLLIDPSIDSVYAALRFYSNHLDSNDQFFLFNAGHGDYDEQFFDDGFLVFANSSQTDKDPFKKTYLQYAEFQKIINQFRARHVFVMLDVCFGGAFESRINQQSFRTKNDVYANLENAEFVKEKLRFRSRIFMTSGGKNVVPDGYDKMHSPFAKQFLKALRDAADRGMLTTSNIFTYVEALPSGPRKGVFGNDEPGSEFVFIAEKKNSD